MKIKIVFLKLLLKRKSEKKGHVKTLEIGPLTDPPFQLEEQLLKGSIFTILT